MPPPSPRADLTGEEIFRIVLLECLKDGDLDALEMSLVQSVKQVLRIDAPTHQRLFAEVARSLSASIRSTDSADPDRIYGLLAARALEHEGLGQDELQLLDGIGALLSIPSRRRRDLEIHAGKGRTRRGLVQGLQAVYTLGEVIGQGGMSTVFEGVEEGTSRIAAVKVLSLSVEASCRARFAREISVMRSMSGPGLVGVLDWGQTDSRSALPSGQPASDLPFLVMDRVQGLDLNRLRGDHGPLPVPAARAIASQVARTLARVHERGVVHRDVKPSNLMLTAQGVVVLMDMGLAHDSKATMMTRDGVLLGTPRYLAPEVLEGAPVDAAQDVYALGVSVHELLTGRPLYEGLSLSEIVRKVLTQPPPVLPPDTLPGPQADLHRASLDRDPTRRPSALDYCLRMSGRGPDLEGPALWAAARQGQA